MAVRAICPILALLLGCSFSAYAEVNCTRPQNDTEIFTCADQSKSFAETELNTQYRAAKARIEKNMVDHDPKTMTNALIHAQKAWLVYRDEQCKIEAGSSALENTNPHLVFINQCISRIDLVRAKELEKMCQ